MWKRKLKLWELSTVAVLLTGACADARPIEPHPVKPDASAMHHDVAPGGPALEPGDPPQTHSTVGAALPASTPVACGTVLTDYHNRFQWLELIGTRVTARGVHGFSSFTMENGYNVAAHPLHTPGAASRSIFTASKGATHFAGPFHEVFPGRGSSDVDRWEFWVYRTGALWLRSITWGGSWTSLQGVTCYRGPQSQLVVTGHISNPGFGTDFWTFVIRPATLF